MANDKIKELENYKNKIAELEAAIEAERREKLATLHETVGLTSVEELIEALQSLGASGKRGKRTRITPAMKEQIGKALKDGEKGSAVARKFGVSVPTIQNIKKELGLVKKTAKKRSRKK